LLQAAIDGAVQQPARRPILDDRTAGGQLDAATRDTPGSELTIDDSAG